MRLCLDEYFLPPAKSYQRPKQQPAALHILGRVKQFVVEDAAADQPNLPDRDAHPEQPLRVGTIRILARPADAPFRLPLVAVLPELRPLQAYLKRAPVKTPFTP